MLVGWWFVHSFALIDSIDPAAPLVERPQRELAVSVRLPPLSTSDADAEDLRTIKDKDKDKDTNVCIGVLCEPVRRRGTTPISTAARDMTPCFRSLCGYVRTHTYTHVKAEKREQTCSASERQR